MTESSGPQRPFAYWGTARVTWTAQGYELSIHVRTLNRRMILAMLAEVGRAISPIAGDSLTVDFDATDERLRITTDKIVEFTPEGVYRVVERALDTAHSDVSAAFERERTEGVEWLAELRSFGDNPPE